MGTVQYFQSYKAYVTYWIVTSKIKNNLPEGNLPSNKTSLNESQKREGGQRRADSLLLVLLAKMRSGTYADFREGPPTLVNIVGVGD